MLIPVLAFNKCNLLSVYSGFNCYMHIATPSVEETYVNKNRKIVMRFDENLRYIL